MQTCVELYGIYVSDLCFSDPCASFLVLVVHMLWLWSSWTTRSARPFWDWTRHSPPPRSRKSQFALLNTFFAADMTRVGIQSISIVSFKQRTANSDWLKYARTFVMQSPPCIVLWFFVIISWLHYVKSSARSFFLSRALHRPCSKPA